MKNERSTGGGRRPRRTTRAASRRGRALFLCGAATATLLGLPARGLAQTAFQGNFTVASGSVSAARSATQDTITVGSPTAVIDWTPTDAASGGGAIDFPPAGKTGLFQGNGAFTILNRITPADTSRAIAFNGHVVSQIVDPSTGQTTTGGNVWFYAPGGLLLGAGAVFDVGSLVLTTDAIRLDANDALPDPAEGLRFTGASGSRATIAIDPAAQINATTKGSYVALVAPRIVQGGTVDVNGTAAYVAAEVADVTIHGGLFDIAVTTGTSVAGGTAADAALVHTGTTTGAGATGAAGGNQAIYLVAVPKNNTITMLASGTLGYRPAASAAIRDGVVVLSGGSDVATTAGGGDTPAVALHSNGASGSVTIGLDGASALSDVVGRTTGGIVTASGNALIAAGGIDLTGTMVGVGSIVASGAIALTATSGGISAGALHATGGGIALAATSSLSAGNLTADAGDIALSSTNAQIGVGGLSASGDVAVHSLYGIQLYDGSTGRYGDAVAGRDITIVDGLDNGNGSRTGYIYANTLRAGGTIGLRELGYTTNVYGDIVAGGDLALYTASNLYVAGSVGAASLRTLDAQGNLQPVGTVALAGSFTVAGTLSLAAGDLDISAGQALTIGTASLAASRYIDLRSSGGGVSLASYSGNGAPSTVTLAGTSVTLGSDVAASGTIALTASTGSVTARRLASDQGDVAIAAPAGAIYAGTLSAGRDVSTTSLYGIQLYDGSTGRYASVTAGRDITIADGLDDGTGVRSGYVYTDALDAGGAIGVREIGYDAYLGALSAGSAIDARAARYLGVRGAVASAADGSVALSAGGGTDGTIGTLTISGRVDGATIALDSGAISIASSSAIGGGDTQSVVITNTGGRRTVIGDGYTSNDATYGIDAYGLSRVSAHQITIVAPAVSGDPARAPDLVLADLTVAGENNTPSGTAANIIGTDGALTFRTTGTMMVAGRITASNLYDGDTVALVADGRIDGILPAARIALTDDAGRLS